jgi:hypothetical protein
MRAPSRSQSEAEAQGNEQLQLMKRQSESLRSRVQPEFERWERLGGSRF